VHQNFRLIHNQITVVSQVRTARQITQTKQFALAFSRALFYHGAEQKRIGQNLTGLQTKSGIAVVLVAAGRGERAGSPHEGPKQYRLIGGAPVVRHTLTALLAHPSIGEIVTVIHPDDIDLFETAAAGFGNRVRHVIGGTSRQASTLHGLQALVAHAPEYVMIHDAVRPFVSRDLLDRIAEILSADSGAVPALPVSDTIKRSDPHGHVSETVSRADLFAAQTPQAFPFAAILRAHEKARDHWQTEFTDDASIAEFAGLKVRLVEGAPENIKLTWRDDIETADKKLSGPAAFPDVRVGNGYDVHALVPGGHVTLCGVRIAHDASLSGHSDADVGLHALTDALLATCGAGDIGVHFPPSDPQWRGAASRIFVEHAAAIVRGAGGRVANADVTLICEAPKISLHREAMVSAIAAMLQIAPSRVSVKATTNEKLGFIGRSEGIAAIATVSVVYPGELE
jgi:2-C-methyl-D-erythritol 4-phosphate cytidylyltransferase / 2-C-methyl-D-erythritol 2,4-cyclodiphosphate synthase